MRVTAARNVLDLRSYRLRQEDPTWSARSITSGWMPRSASATAADRPEVPAPTITTR